jgi:hypothetical protein
MQFLFQLFNHSESEQVPLHDLVYIIGRQLEALGHSAVWRPQNDRFLRRSEGVNLVFERFGPAATAVLAREHAKGARFVCLATEEPIEGKGFNHGCGDGMTARMEAFGEAARYFDGILHLVPGDHVQRWYGQYAPSAFIEMGYAPGLVRRDDGVEPDYAFGFFGVLSERRQAILEVLTRYAAAAGIAKPLRIEASFVPQAARDRIIRQARVVVQIRKFEPMGLVSSSRCNVALMLGRPVIAEPHDLSRPWDEVVRFAPSLDAFFIEAIAMQAAWRDVHRDQFARLRERFSPERCLGEPLRRIGLA